MINERELQQVKGTQEPVPEVTVFHGPALPLHPVPEA